jgi:hypothetical protein
MHKGLILTRIVTLIDNTMTNPNLLVSGARQSLHGEVQVSISSSLMYAYLSTLAIHTHDALLMQFGRDDLLESMKKWWPNTVDGDVTFWASECRHLHVSPSCHASY